MGQVCVFYSLVSSLIIIFSLIVLSASSRSSLSRETPLYGLPFGRTRFIPIVINISMTYSHFPKRDQWVQSHSENYGDSWGRVLFYAKRDTSLREERAHTVVYKRYVIEADYRPKGLTPSLVPLRQQLLYKNRSWSLSESEMILSRRVCLEVRQ